VVVASYSSGMGWGCMLGGCLGPSHTFMRGGVAWAGQHGRVCSSWRWHVSGVVNKTFHEVVKMVDSMEVSPILSTC